MAINNILRAVHIQYCLMNLSLILFFLLGHFPLMLYALSFNYPDFTNAQNLNLSGDAFFSDGILSLTRNRADVNLIDSVGRAVYAQELHLSDRSTGKVADFVTHFTFNISMLQPPNGGDGITLFLAPNGSHIPDDAWGGCLALIGNCSTFNTTGEAIVAVEFDTYQNEWDSDANHVGINVNSIASVANVSWSRSIKDGSKAKAWVTYNSMTRNLSLFLSYDDNPVFVGNSSLSYEIDLSKVLPEWVSVGFSSSTGFRTEIHYILSWEFNSTEITSPLPDSPTPMPDSPTPLPDTGGSKSNVGLIVGCAVGGSVLVIGLICLYALVVYRKRARKEKEVETDDSMDYEFEQGTGPKKFTYSELVQATNNFDEHGKLGEGGFGGVYKGHLPNPISTVAVKRVSRASKQGKKEYTAEVKIISRLRHKNLVQLLGWCHEKGELLLVYEFMPNGSLDSHLFKEENRISWSIRYKISIGLASALVYLHEEWEQCVVHRDIKTSNVMLDSNFNTKLGDFGLARFADHELGLKTTGLAGTFGYMAPEYISTGKASKASDVYSFGVVVLEIACGRRSIEARNEEVQVSLVAWVWDSYGNGELLAVADKRLSTDFDRQQMECMLIVGLWCAHPDHNLRPTIRQALQVLNFEAPLPNLPVKMPVAKYDAATSTSSTEPLLSSFSVSTGR